MNKKKFFATCTLVAFGATMVPAMAFADAPESSGSTTFSANVFSNGADGTGFVETIVKDEGITVTFGGVEETWLATDSVLNVMVYDKKTVGGNVIEDASSKFTLSDPKVATGNSTEGTNGTIKIKAKENAVFVPGYYVVSVKDAKDSKNVSDEVIIDAPLGATPIVSSVSGVNNDGEVTTPGSVGLVNVAATGISDAAKQVFDLGESYRQIKGGEKAIGALTATAGSGTISAELLTVGHFYAVGEADPASGTKYPTIVFEYTEEVAAAVQKAIDAAKKAVNDDLSKIVDEYTTEVAADINLTDATPGNEVLLKDGESFGTNNAVFIAKGFDVDGVPIVVADTYNGDTGEFTSVDENVVYDNIRRMLVNGDLTGEVKVVVQNTDTKKISAEKTVKVTLTDKKTDAEKMAAYAEAMKLSNYNANALTNYGDDTATLEITSADYVLTAPTGVTIGTLDYDLSKYLKKNGQELTVKNMPTETITGKLELTTADPVGKITVTLTIKAGDIEQPSDKEEAGKVVIEKAATFDELVVAAGAEVDDTEFAAILTAYMELLQAYMAYVQIA